jgi:transposase-like protein
MFHLEIANRGKGYTSPFRKLGLRPTQPGARRAALLGTHMHKIGNFLVSSIFLVTKVGCQPILVRLTNFGALLVAQHFLKSSAARSLSLGAIMRMSAEEAFATFQQIRFAANAGAPFCPRCGTLHCYSLAEIPIRWKCSECKYKFSVTSGTIFHARKLPIRDYLAVIALFVNGVKGTSALQISRDLDINQKSAFILLHKLREAVGSAFDDMELSGEVEIDGLYTGSYVKPENRKADRKDRRLVEEQSGRRQVVVVARQRHGNAITWIVQRESEAVPLIRAVVASGTIVHADESPAWDQLHASYEMRRVNHSKEYKSEDGACTNWAESFFSRFRRAEYGQHHRISGKYLYAYASEMAWRENNRRNSNGANWKFVTTAALTHPKSETWVGRWHPRKVA